ncbi:MAG: PAS domain S-box protein [Burkholderiales bacterium]
MNKSAEDQSTPFSESECRRLMLTQATLLDAVPACVALVDEAALILAVNRNWAELVRSDASWPPAALPGDNYLSLCESFPGEAGDDGRQAALGIRSVLDGAAADFSFDFVRRDALGDHRYRMQVGNTGLGALISHTDITQKPEAPEAAQLIEGLQRQRAREHRLLRTLIDVLPDAVYTLDANGAFTLCNRATLQAFGVDRERDLAGKTVFDLMSAAAAERADAENRRVMAGQPMLDREERHIDRAGVWQWRRSTKVPLRDAENGIVGMVAIDRNITERKRAQQESRELVERLGNTLEGLIEGFCTIDREWRLTYVNRQAERLLGRPRVELLGRTVWERMPALVGTAFEAALRRALEHDEVVEIVEFLATRRRWYEVRIHPSRSGIAVYLRDVSRQKWLAARLEAKRLRFAVAQEVAMIGSWATDLTTGALEWSVGTHLIFETDRQRFHPSHEGLPALIHPDDRRARSDAFAKSLTQRTAQVLEYRLLLPGGIEKYVEERWQVYFDPQGEAIRALGTIQDITRRKRAEQKLLDKQAMLDLSGRLGRIGAWTVELAGLTLVWSDEVCNIHEVPPGTSHSLAEALAFYPSEWIDISTRAFKACVEQGIAYDLELEIVTAKGRRIWVRTIGEAIRDEAGTIRRVQGAFQDLSERKMAEEETRRLAARLTNTVESITDGFFTLDRDWHFTYVNGEAENLLKRKRAELIGHTLWEAFPLALGTEFERGYRRAMEDGVAVTFEALYAPFESWNRVNVFPSDEGLSIYFRDVTLDRAARQQLELLEASVAQLNDIVLITEAAPLDAPGPRIVFVNDAFERTTGYGRDEVLGQTPRLLQGALTDRAELDRVRAALERFKPVHAELLNYPKAGEPFWVEMDIVPVGSDGANPTHFVAVARDITERRRDHLELRELNSDLEARVRSRTAELSLARDAAEHANGAKSRFLAAMSHEIRTPMNGVIGMIDVLAQGKLEPDQREIVRVAHESAFALLATLDDVLDFSKIEAGQFQIDSEPMGIERLVEGACGMLGPVARKSGVAITVFTDPALPSFVRGDPARLRQVLLNLLANAIKFSSAERHSGRVEVRASLVEAVGHFPAVELVVADNGIGMDESMLGRLFTPFSQADASTTRLYGGTGLGLSISHALVEMMGGKIEVVSKLGRGATFTVRLPLLMAPAPAESEPVSIALSGLCCLVLGSAQAADDARAYLAHSGADVHLASDVAAGCDWLRTAPPGPCIVVITGLSLDATALDELRSAAVAGKGLSVAFVVVQGRPFPLPPTPESGGDLLVLSQDIVYRNDFLEAVASAANLTHRPQVPPATSPAVSEARATASNQASSVRHEILVAEDNETNQIVLRKQLDLLGFAARISRDGMEALECLRDREYPLLLTDLHMPRMDGYELAAAVRASETGSRRMPIVALTANVLRSDTDRCRDVGMDDCLIKPVKLATLKAMLSKFLPDAFVSSASPGDPHGSQGPRVEPEPIAAAADLDVLIALIGDDPAAIDEVLKAFRVSAVQASRDLNLSARTGSLRIASETAHRLKSGASALGATRLADVCSVIEATAETGGAAVLSALLPRFELELNAVYRFLDSIPSRTR